MLFGLYLVGGFATCQKWIYLRKKGKTRNSPGKRAISRKAEAMGREGLAERKKRCLCRLNMRVLGL